ncbi:C-type lectin domain family 4 member E isoform X2 [Danio rerio]
MTVSLGLLCVLLLVIIILQHFIIIPERNMKKCTDEDLQRTQFCLPGHHPPPLRQEPTTKTTAKPSTKASKQDEFFSSMDSKNWSESRQYCRDRGEDLLIIKSEEKQRRVTSFITEKVKMPVWLGLTDAEIEGNMIWVDNSPLNEGFWMRGEPTNNDGIEDCVFMNAISSPNWNDVPCFICE